jgi:hypothetical protein
VERRIDGIDGWFLQSVRLLWGLHSYRIGPISQTKLHYRRIGLHFGSLARHNLIFVYSWQFSQQWTVIAVTSDLIGLHTWYLDYILLHRFSFWSDWILLKIEDWPKVSATGQTLMSLHSCCFDRFLLSLSVCLLTAVWRLIARHQERRRLDIQTLEFALLSHLILLIRWILCGVGFEVCG